MKIRVTNRGHDYHACPEGAPGIWGCGKTPDEAIGSMIQAHPEHFKLTIEHKK